MVSHVLAFGHSHLGALQTAYERRARRATPLIEWRFKQLWGLYEPFVVGTEPQIQYNKDLEADLLQLSEHADADAVLLGCLLGSEHFLWSVQGQVRPFDIVLPFDDTLPVVPGAELIPYSLAYRFAYDTISSILMFNGRLRALTGRSVYQMLPPPPVADQKQLLACAPGLLREEMLAFGVPHAAIRYKLWRLWVVVAEDIAKRDGVQLCGSLAGTTDAAGMLLEEFSSDAVHGNERYGLYAIHRFEEMLR